MDGYCLAESTHFPGGGCDFKQQIATQSLHRIFSQVVKTAFKTKKQLYGVYIFSSRELWWLQMQFFYAIIKFML